MRAVIVANGLLKQAITLRPDDLLIAADGGARRCLELGLRPAYVVGDLDSLDAAQLAILEKLGTQIVRYPTRKDYTDLELALQHAHKLGASEILILGALGARWDQTAANILLAAAFTDLPVSLADGTQQLFFVHAGEQLEICGQPGDTLSLIPLTPQAQGVTTRNLEYPLDQETLFFGSTRGVSNVLQAACATISLKEGVLLCTIIHS